MVGARTAMIPKSEAFHTRHEVKTRGETCWMWTVAYRWWKRKSSSAIFDLYRACMCLERQHVKSTNTNSKPFCCQPVSVSVNSSFANTELWITRFEKNGINKKMGVAIKNWSCKTNHFTEIGEFFICLSSFTIMLQIGSKSTNHSH